MALQGDLQSFALNDVLRLLAGTSKSGRLAVAGSDRKGDLWLDGGRIAGGEVSSAPYATEVVDVVLELLRFGDGSFAFHDDETAPDTSASTEVEEALARAEELLAEWQAVEAVVPSMDSWVMFAPEIDGEETTVSAAHWKVLAALGGGLTVRELGSTFEHTDLAASRQVKELVEAGLAKLGDAPAERPAPVQAPVKEAEPVPAPTAPVATADPVEATELSVLEAEDGPVVIETSEDALLPEPLPSEGTSFAGELDDMASVDSPAPEEVASADSDDSPALPAEETEFDPHADDAHGIEFGDPEPPVTRRSDGTVVGAEDSEPFADADDFFGAADSNEEVGDDPLGSTPSTGNDAGSGGGDDTDRGALLDFLSSVKP